MGSHLHIIMVKRMAPSQAGGSKSLQDLLAKEEEEALPEFKRARPKYYYYYNWMRERVTRACGQLPAPVLEKLIRIDATELDMLITYPKGIQRQVSETDTSTASFSRCSHRCSAWLSQWSSGLEKD